MDSKAEIVSLLKEILLELKKLNTATIDLEIATRRVEQAVKDSAVLIKKSQSKAGQGSPITD